MCKSKRSDNTDKALSDNEEPWKQFKNFSENRMPKSTVSEKISAQNWKNHFQKLHSETRENLGSIPLIAENKPSKSLNKPVEIKELLSVIIK